MKKLLSLIVKRRVAVGFVFAAVYAVSFKKGMPSAVMAGFLLVTIGETVRLLAALQLRKIEVLSTTGIYSVTRNPLYLGSFVVGCGFILMSFSAETIASSLFFLVVFSALYIYVYSRTIENEERSLSQKFGAEYAAYVTAVPRFFPSITSAKWRGPAQLSMSLFIRNGEYRTVTGILLIITFIFIK